MSQRLTAIVIISVGVLVQLGSLAYLLSSTRTATLTLSQTLAGLPLTDATYGPEAVAEINRLHGKEFPISAGALGTYGNATAQATVWVSQFASRAVAGQIVEAMRDKIAAGRSPFEPIGTRPMGSRVIYELRGLGQQHFYFQANDRVIWLAVDQPLADQALSQALEVYP